jgi:hypothetical protein
MIEGICALIIRSKKINTCGKRLVRKDEAFLLSEIMATIPLRQEAVKSQRRLVAQRGQVNILVEGTLWPQLGQLNQ